MAPTALIIISDMELGNPYTPLIRGMEVVRPTEGVDGTGYPKKRMPARNGQDRVLLPRPERVLTWDRYSEAMKEGATRGYIGDCGQIRRPICLGCSYHGMRPR